MRFIKIGESYAVNADRILDATYTAKGYEESAEGLGAHTEAVVTIRIAGARWRCGHFRGETRRPSGAT